MKRWIHSTGTAVVLGLAVGQAWAHDEGHGPKVTDASKFGGALASVIDAAETKLGPKAKALYRAELVRLEDGTVEVHLFDLKMKPVKPEGLMQEAVGYLETVSKGKSTRVPFSLKLVKGYFLGKPAAPSRKPYNIDVVFKVKSLSLMAAFDNLD